MTPFQQFVNGLLAARMEVNEVLNELLAFAEVMRHKQNSVELDQDGTFYVTAAGNIEQVIETLKQHLAKLERIKLSKDNI